MWGWQFCQASSDGVTFTVTAAQLQQNGRQELAPHVPELCAVKASGADGRLWAMVVPGYEALEGSSLLSEIC